jgi:hypothetical protein
MQPDWHVKRQSNILSGYLSVNPMAVYYPITQGWPSMAIDQSSPNDYQDTVLPRQRLVLAGLVRSAS